MVQQQGSAGEAVNWFAQIPRILQMSQLVGGFSHFLVSIIYGIMKLRDFNSGFSFSFQWSPRYERIFVSTFWHSPKLCIQYFISIVKNHHSSFVTMTYDQRATFQSIEWIHSLRYEVGCIALLWMAYMMGYTLKYLWNLPTYIEDYRPYITPGLYIWIVNH